MNTKCFFGFHKWKYSTDHGSGLSKRYCPRCNKTQFRCIDYMVDVWA